MSNSESVEQVPPTPKRERRDSERTLSLTTEEQVVVESKQRSSPSAEKQPTDSVPAADIGKSRYYDTVIRLLLLFLESWRESAWC